MPLQTFTTHICCKFLGAYHQLLASWHPCGAYTCVDSFLHLDSLQSSGGCCRLGMKPHIWLSVNVISPPDHIWRQAPFIAKQISLFQSLVLSVLLYATDMKSLEVFYMICFAQVLDIVWYQNDH